MRALTVVTALVVMLASVVAAPRVEALDETGTASVEGRISAPAGHSVEGFTVWAFRKFESDGSHSWPHVATGATDRAGRWRLDGLAAGTYRFRFSKDHGTELVDRFHGGQSSPWTAQDVVVADGAQVSGVRTPMQVGGTVAGTVRSEHGDGIVTIRVLAYEAVDVYGLGDLNWQLVRATHTDEKGRYELDRLRAAPHRIYFLDPQDRGYERQYYPGVTELEAAETLEVRAAEAFNGIDARLSGGPEPSRVTVVKAPKVKGRPRVGRTLRVTRGVWEPGKVTLRRQWFVRVKGRAVPLKKARKARLKLRRIHRGKQLRVRVVVRAAGHEAYVFRSRWTRRVRT